MDDRDDALARLVLETLALPGADKKRGMRAFYNYLGQRVPAAAWLFSNYGYAPGVDEVPSPSPLPSPPGAFASDQRAAQALYLRVARGLPRRSTRLVEVGCGRGGGCVTLAGVLEPQACVGVDLSTEMIRFCNERHAGATLSFVVGDAEALPFPDASVDVVVNVESSHCYADLRRFFREVERVLVPGGRFAYADFFPSDTLAAIDPGLTTHGLAPLAWDDITAQVMAAIEQEEEALGRRLEAHVGDALLRRQLQVFAGRGSPAYQGMKDGSFRYLSTLREKRSASPSRPA